MLVLFANLNAGFSPSDPGGAGVVSIWIPETHFFRVFALDFQLLLRMSLSQRSYLLKNKLREERWISEEGMLTFENNLDWLLLDGLGRGRVVRLGWVVLVGWWLVLVRWWLVAVRRPRPWLTLLGVW